MQLRGWEACSRKWKCLCSSWEPWKSPSAPLLRDWRTLHLLGSAVSTQLSPVWLFPNGLSAPQSWLIGRSIQALGHPCQPSFMYISIYVQLRTKGSLNGGICRFEGLLTSRSKRSASVCVLLTLIPHRNYQASDNGSSERSCL